MSDGDGTLSAILAVVLIGIASVGWYYFFTNKSTSQISADRIAQATTRSSEDIAAIAKQCKATGKPWKDPSFGHDEYPGDSIGHTLELRDGERGKKLDLGDGGVSWQPPSKFCASSRPMGVRGDGVPTWLYSDVNGDGVVSAAEGMELTDAAQGSVGDCYFMSALAAAVQHHPDLADDLIDETYEEQGIYGVSFWMRGKWKMIWVDSYFPCYRPSSKSHRGKYRLIFASSKDRKEIWPLVVEKAFAKLAGSYEAISGGQISEALQMLTGGSGRRHRASSMDWNAFKEQVKSDDYLVGAGSQQESYSAEGAAEQKKLLRGIVTGHAYTVVNVYDDEDGGLKLVELRNPWGHGEWTGDWGARSSMWTGEQGRKAQEIVGSPNSQHGRFWMSWDDFTECFDSIDSVHMNFSEEDRARRDALREEAIRIVSTRPTADNNSNSNDDDADDGLPYTQESADAMMAQLIAEEAAEKRKQSVGARGNKKTTNKKSARKKKR